MPRLLVPPITRLLCAALSAAAVTCNPFGPSAVRATVTRGYVSAARLPVAPGVFHDSGTLETDTAGRQAVHVVEIETGERIIRFEASLSNDRVAGLETTSSQANRRNREGHRAVAAINADFWGTRQEPIGLHIQDGELVTASATARPTFGVERDGDPMIGSPLITATLLSPGGSSQRIVRVNQPRAAGQLVLYTARYDTSTRTDDSGTEVVLSSVSLPIAPEGRYSASVREVRSRAGNTPIGAEDVVLSGVGAAAAFLDLLAPGDELGLTFSITAGWQDVIHAAGGGQFIVRDGLVDVRPHNPGFADVTHPRSAIGLGADGNVIMATVDGRQPGYSIGVRLDELGELMVSRGAVTAINLDGGGSTTMAVRLPGDDGVTVVNRGSDGFERAVSNSLLVYSTAPTGPLAIANVVPPQFTVLSGTDVTYTVRGQDAAYNAVRVDPASIEWATEGEAGRIDQSGRFTSLAAGIARVRARIGQVVGKAVVTVVQMLEALEVRPGYAIVQPGGTQSFTAVGRSSTATEVQVGATVAMWSVDGPIGTIDRHGVLTAAEAPSSGNVRALAGGASGMARVDIGRAPSILEDFEDLSDMRAAAARATASLTSAMRPDPVRAGTRSGRLSYDFTRQEPGTSAAYATHSPLREIDGRPQRIGVWLYGDGSRHWVRGNYRDGSDIQRTIDFTQSPTPTPTRPEDCVLRSRGIDWVGWRYLDAPIPSDALLPLKWERVYVVETVDLCDNASAVYLDDLRAVYSDTGEDLIGPTVSELLPLPGSTIAQARPEIGGTIRDNPGGSGVAPDSIRLLIDEVQVAVAYDEVTGQARYTPPAPLDDGLHRIRLEATDRSGNPALPFGDWTFTIASSRGALTSDFLIRFFSAFQ